MNIKKWIYIIKELLIQHILSKLFITSIDKIIVDIINKK